MLHKISNDIKGPAYKAIAESLAKDIDSGVLKPGETIPPIKRYAEELGTSASTVNRAYEYLTARGYLLPLQGSGIQVAPRDTMIGSKANDFEIFLSYAHRDDELSHGAITMLRERIQEEYTILTGDEANIFQDTKDIEWGADWKSVIEENLGAAKFFIPILSPTYLRSPYCLGELKRAASMFQELGLEDGICPIEFVDIARTLELMHDDQIATLLSDRQRCFSWKEHRNEDPDSFSYRSAVHEIVEALIAKESKLAADNNARVEWSSPDAGASDYDDVEPLERIAAIENDSEKVIESINNVAAVINTVSNIFTEENNVQQNMTPQNALALAGRIAGRLDEGGDALIAACAEYDKAIVRLDGDMEAYVELASIFPSATSDGAHQQIADLYEEIAGLNQKVEEPFAQVESMRDALRQLQRVARVLRKPCRKIDSALDVFASSKSIFKSWELKLEGLLNAGE